MKLSESLLISNLGILKNLSDFFQSLTLIDVIFFFSVILLMILIVVLIYFIKLNEDEVEVVEEKKIEPVKDEIVLPEKKYSDEEEGELLDLASITKALENKEVETIDLTAFEEEQERDAIISYDELINKTKAGEINYKSENMYDDLSVKEVDLDNLITEQENKLEKKEEVLVLSYSQEEAFLSALKQLQKQIN